MIDFWFGGGKEMCGRCLEESENYEDATYPCEGCFYEAYYPKLIEFQFLFQTLKMCQNQTDRSEEGLVSSIKLESFITYATEIFHLDRRFVLNLFPEIEDVFVRAVNRVIIEKRKQQAQRRVEADF